MRDAAASGRRPTIGVLCGWQVHNGRLDTYLEAVLTGLIDAARKVECNLMIASGVATTNSLWSTAWPAVRSDQLFTPVGPSNTDGLIIINPLWNDESLKDVRRWQAEGHPIVFIGRGGEGPTVVVDNRGGIAQAVEHLAAHGHRRIAFLYARDGDGPERQRSYEEAVQRLGLESDPALLAHAAHEPFGGRRAIDELLNGGVAFTAVVASNESSGRGALERLGERGVQTPGEVAVIGFDDFIEALATVPAMTCVRAPIDGVAERALELLVGELRDGVPPAELAVVPTTLTVRESCGCTPAYDGDAAERSRRAIAQRIVREGEFGRSMASFSARLLATSQLDMLELGRILLETLPAVGVDRSLLGVYSAEGDDPVAWTVAQPAPGEELLRFPTRAFPPPELVGDDPFRLLVIPLRLHDELGFMALSTENLAFGVAIASQSEAAFESVRNLRVREAAEAALADSEEQLRQAQKMEAVGRLAGGVAHDFNNLLTAISGYTEIVLADLTVDDRLDRRKLSERVTMIASAAARAAALTRQLLAFSRRQIMQPVVLDLNEVVEETHALLERVLGDDVEVAMQLAPDAGRVKVDRNQLEQVIINLAVNARDAMPRGGAVSLATQSTVVEHRHDALSPEAGAYVTLTVADTGVGMSEETRSHAFEPFYTTKEQGTGLGLATAYGIVKQSGGEITVESVPGLGSVFTVYLPRVDEAVAPDTEPLVPGLTGAAGTILLVEDEDGVRTFVKEILLRHGLEVLVAANGEEALALSRAHDAPIDALVTDVVMPFMNGRELAGVLVAERPDLRVLYISGYAEEAIFDQYVIAPTTAFLAKPFSGVALMEALSGLLGAATPAGPAPV